METMGFYHQADVTARRAKATAVLDAISGYAVVKDPDDLDGHG